MTVAYDLASISRDLEHFNQESLEEYYANGAGLKEEMQMASVYARFAHLFQRSLYDWLRHQEAAIPEDQPMARRRVHFLLGFCAGGYLEQAVKEELDAIVTEETRAQLEVDGRILPYRMTSVELANEPDRQRRSRLNAAREAFVAGLNSRREQVLSHEYRLVNELGFSDYRQLYGYLKGLDWAGLGAQMKDLLQRTEAAYVASFGPALQAKCGIELSQAEKHDVARLLRAPEFDAFFPAKRLVAALKTTLRGMGIDLDRQPNVTLDTVARPLKSPRAFCAPVRVPGDVRLVIMPHGGQDDYHSLFHEAGHTEHFAHTRADLEAEFRYLGDNAVTEAYAFLLEYLVVDPQWLAEHTPASADQIAAYTAFAALERRYFLRRYAGKLLYELELHAHPQLRAGIAERYRALLSEATRIRYPAVDYLADVDAGFYVADYLRAWALEVILRRELMRRFGRRWFTSPRAGELLRELWSTGQARTADDVARSLGYAEGVTFEPLIEELTTGREPAAG